MLPHTHTDSPRPRAQVSSGTLDESVADTLRRDAQRVRTNVKAVLLPGRFGGDPVQALRDWDLWGPLIFTMVMARAPPAVRIRRAHSPAAARRPSAATGSAASA